MVKKTICIKTSKDELKVQLIGSSRLSMKKNLSIIYLKSAALFARNSDRIEKMYSGDWDLDESKYNEDLSYVTGTIFTSVSFLESTINELLFDANYSISKNHHIYSNFNPGAISNLKKFLLNIRQIKKYQDNIDIERLKILDKYQLFLEIVDKPLFDKGKNPYQDVDGLISLRNDLIHYKPELLLASKELKKGEKPHKHELALKGKFEENAFQKAGGNPFYPYKCLGHGCAEWAVISSKKFIDVFYDNLGIKPKYDFSNSEFYTKSE